MTPPRFAQRILPVEAVCYASVAEISRAIAPLLQRHFGPAPVAEAAEAAGGAAADAAAPAAAGAVDDGSPSLKWSIVFESRSCDGLKLERLDVINAVAALVPKRHKVDLDAPQLVVMVQVVKSAAALAVLSDYHLLKKYNIRSLTTPAEGAEGEAEGEGKAAGKEGEAADGEDGEEEEEAQ